MPSFHRCRGVGFRAVKRSEPQEAVSSVADIALPHEHHNTRLRALGAVGMERKDGTFPQTLQVAFGGRMEYGWSETAARIFHCNFFQRMLMKHICLKFVT